MVHQGKKKITTGPQQANMAIRSGADYNRRLSKTPKVRDGQTSFEAVESRRGKCMQENCRRTDSESVRGESRGAGVASGHKDSVVGVDVFPQRQSLSASNSLFSLGAPSLLEFAVRFIHLVTHAPGPAGGISKNEGWARRGACSRRGQLGESGCMRFDPDIVKCRA